MKRKIIGGFLVMMLVGFQAFATHNRAGEITYKHLGGLRYEITITTYTETSPSGQQADRDFLPIDWGDDTRRDSIKRNQEIPLSIFIKKNIYRKVHEYPGPGRYMISMEDPNRNANVQNIPNSVNVVFYLETELIIDPFAGNNNSVQLLNPPIDFACVGNVFVHNPSAFDPDGDSLVFSLVQSKGFNGVTIPGYSFPAATNSISINSRTGMLIWDEPRFVGEYNVAILIEEYKNGIRTGSVLRDMQITVEPPCQHEPPKIDNIDSYCMKAGEALIFNVTAQDGDDGDLPSDGNEVIIEATGGVFQLNNSATFNLGTPGLSTTGTFTWRTSCENVRKSPYTVIFRAVDNGDPNLSSFKTIDIKVIAPAPENLTATPEKNTVSLAWEESICKNAVGYKIYRRLGATAINLDTCDTGIPADAGYELIHTDSTITTTSFVDDDDGTGLIIGLEYCYRIIAFFPDGAESCVSDEVCVQLKKELPVITNVDVRNTDPTNGSIRVAWSKPTEHDVSVYPGPYRYVLRRKIWNDDFEVIDSTNSIDDTTYIDTLINTTDNEFTYIIDMYDLSDGRTLMGPSVPASSIYLNSLAQDNRLVVQWSEQVPWLNREYVLYRQDPQTDDFVLLDTLTESSYIDDSLTNGVEYCYRLESIGEYLVPGLIRPIINFSQIHCNAPVDTVAPCAPLLSVEAKSCIQDFSGADASGNRKSPCGDLDGPIETQLTWTNPNNVCDDVDDVVSYSVYYKPTLNDPFTQIYTTTNINDTSYTRLNEDGSIAGCYYVTAVDSFNNVSQVIDTICIDNCPYYELPNVFTPGEDGINDFFRPFPYCFIESVQMTIINRWGQTVFETTDPAIEWDGTYLDTGEPVSDGVYFYVCKLKEKKLFGLNERTLKGTVQLLRN